MIYQPGLCATSRWLLQPCKEEFEDLCNELISIGVEICSMMTCGRHAGMQTILERLHAINAERCGICEPAQHHHIEQTIIGMWQ